MGYVKDVLTSLKAETILGQGEAVLSNPDADEAERMEAALALRRLRVLLFGPEVKGAVLKALSTVSSERELE